MKGTKKVVESVLFKMIAKAAYGTAKAEADSACFCFCYQPKMPKEVKQLKTK